MSIEDRRVERLDHLNMVIVLFFAALVIAVHYFVLTSGEKTISYNTEGAGPALITAIDAGWTPGPPPEKPVRLEDKR